MQINNMHGLEIFNHLGCSVGGMYINDKREWMWSIAMDSELFRKQSACMYAGSQPIKTHVLEKSLNSYFRFRSKHATKKR